MFKDAEDDQAFAKIGVMGLQGSGKTYTSAHLALGLVNLMKERNIAGHDKPVMFLDTESGSKWVKKYFANAGIGFKTRKTRAFVDLVPAIKEAERNGSVLIIDSITHFWRELCDSYKQKKNRTKLRFNDYDWIKGEWYKFSLAFLNSNVHIILCGREGFTYDFSEDEDGDKELIKTGVKMKAEGETGYEPSLLIHMEQVKNTKTGEIYNEATILKDRSNTLNGKKFKNPVFENFMSHINDLNLGGAHFGIDESATSAHVVPEGKNSGISARRERDITLDEIQTLLTKYYPSQSKEDKLKKISLLENHFGTNSWERIKTFELTVLQNGRDKLKAELSGALIDSVNDDIPQ